MRRSASEILNDLEMRVSRLERQATITKQSAPIAPSIQEIISFLKREAKTKIGGGFHSLKQPRVEVDPDFWSFTMEPDNRESMEYYRGGERDWQYRWSEPLSDQITNALIQKFPFLANHRWDWSVEITDKGRVVFDFSKDLISKD